MMDLEALIQRAADENGLDPAQLRALIGIESAGDPNALSPKGAMGLMQLMPGTAREMGVTDPNDPEQNIMGGAKYFRQQLDTFGEPALAAAAYNAGPAAVRKYGGVPPYRETRNYVNQFSRRMGMGGMAPGADASAYGEIGDPTAMAMAALPEVSRSAVDMDTIQSTMRVADKLTSGGVTGSLTSPSDREANSTGALAAEMIPTWQTAQKLLNPVNLLQLPMRALRMVDYTLRTAAGAPTLTDSAEQALGFVNSGETIMRDPTATARDAAQQELTTAKGLRGQILNPAQKLVHIFTTDPFEGERKAMTAAQVFRARLAGQRELDAAMKGRTERDQKAMEAPLEIAQKDVNLRKSQAELPYAGRKAAAEVRNLEALPDYRRQSLISQGLGIQRSMATMPDESGVSPGERLRMQLEEARRAADLSHRSAREQIEDNRAAESATRAQIDDRRADESLGITKQGYFQKARDNAEKAIVDGKTLDEVQMELDGTPFEAHEVDVPGWLPGRMTKQIKIRRRPISNPSLSGLSSDTGKNSMLDWSNAKAFAESAAAANYDPAEAMRMWKEYKAGQR